MDTILSIFLLFCGLLFFIMVIILLLKNKVNERDSILWLSGSLVILIFSGKPEWIDYIGFSLGIKYPPALLFLLSTLIILLYVLYQSIQIKKLTAMVKELTQYVAMSDDQQRESIKEAEKLP